MGDEVLFEWMHFLLSPALHAADPQSIGRMHNQVLCSFCESVHTDSAQRQILRFIHRRYRTLSTRVQPAALYASNERASSCCVCRLIGNHMDLHQSTGGWNTAGHTVTQACFRQSVTVVAFDTYYIEWSDSSGVVIGITDSGSSVDEFFFRNTTNAL